MNHTSGTFWKLFGTFFDTFWDMFSFYLLFFTVFALTLPLPFACEPGLPNPSYVDLYLQTQTCIFFYGGYRLPVAIETIWMAVQNTVRNNWNASKQILSSLCSAKNLPPPSYLLAADQCFSCCPRLCPCCGGNPLLDEKF